MAKNVKIYKMWCKRRVSLKTRQNIARNKVCSCFFKRRKKTHTKNPVYPSSNGIKFLSQTRDFLFEVGFLNESRKFRHFTWYSTKVLPKQTKWYDISAIWAYRISWKKKIICDIFCKFFPFLNLMRVPYELGKFINQNK